MSKIVKLYCEGKKDSLDYAILEKLIPSNSIQIVPIGSKNSANSIIHFLEFAKEGEIDNNIVDKANYYFFFRDRDFDKDLKDYPTSRLFTIPENNNGEIIGQICYGEKTTIENYFFYPELFYEYIKDKKEGIRNKITSIDDVKEKFITAAQKLKYYQATRYALSKTPNSTIRLGNTWLDNSGKLPNNLTEQECQKTVKNLIENKKAKVDNWTYDDFQTQYTHFLNVFNEPNFFEEEKFLVWFQGKDFEASLRKELGDFGGYYRFAKKHFDYKKFPDLIELRRLLEEKIKT
jgi:hypothetical protein